MVDELVQFETAKLAKEKGFDNVECSTCYCIGYLNIKENREFRGSPRKTTGKGQPHLALAPTQSLLQRWLREIHEIDIEIQCLWKDKEKRQRCYIYFIYAEEDRNEGQVYKDTYEEILEDALIDALTNLEELKSK